ncbi:MAG: acyl-CoA dehydrogenase family protein [Bdellovibrionota bacterium]
MDFTLNDTQLEIIEMARKFAAKEIAPHIEEDEAKSIFRRELFPKAGQAGLLGITCSTAYDGAGLGTLEYILMLETIAEVSSGYAVSFSVSGLPITIIEKNGTEAQKKKYIPSLVAGTTIGAFCLTEPNSGSDAASLVTKAEKKGDKYILNGVKQFITHGIQADTFIVMARTGGPGSKGISAFVVEKAFGGIKGGKLEKKMGMRVSPTQEVLFENVEVPLGNMIGGEGEGFTVAKRALDSGRISMAAVANGISKAALTRAVAYAKVREQFGKSLMEYQGVSFMLADMATELEASRLLTREAAAFKDAGQSFVLQASMAKLKSTEACMKITTDAVQVLGGYGYMEDYTVERYMREAKMLQIVEGTSQIQRLLIARNL